jgi:deoxyribonuclease V
LLETGKLPPSVRYVAGVDVSSSRRSNSIWAGVVVFRYPRLEQVEARWRRGTTTFPYIPGLLSFRELPLLLETVRQVESDPDVILCDGQGIAHPRGLGLASHLGLWLDRATVGCAKSRLIGAYTRLGEHKGSSAPLLDKGEVIGAAARTRSGVKPLFISPGHRMDLTSALRLAFDCTVKYRIPEPIRQAHLLVNRARNAAEGGS